MIAISGLLVVVAFVTLIVGIFQSGLGMIYVSIAASVAAAISLATGVVRSRPKAVAVGGPEPIGTWGGTATPVLDRPAEEQHYQEEAPVAVVEEEQYAPTQALSLEAEEEEAEEEAAPKPAPRARAGAARPRKAAAPRAAATVVVVPGRDKYHKDSCRYAKGQVTQSLTKTVAKREGYSPCGVCKP